MATRAALVALALAAPVFADAPVGGPEQQYDNFDESDNEITDRWTHLVWDRAASAPTPFDQAKTSSCTGGKRLPSLKELLTIVDESPHSEYEQGVVVARAIDRSAFHDTPPEYFWTSSMDGADVWVVDFRDGRTAAVNSSNTNARVRCVRYEGP